MRLAIMQPYFFPYYGYFDLISKVDLFLFLTDVQYIRRGWINRNRIRSGQYITVPISHCHQSTKIKDIRIAGEWKSKVLSSLRSTYKKATLHTLYKLIERQTGSNLSSVLQQTIIETASFLGINTKFEEAEPTPGRGKELISNLCRKYGATTYVNLPGGRELYNKFDIDIEFVDTVPDYSILDFCLRDTVPSPTSAQHD